MATFLWLIKRLYFFDSPGIENVCRNKKVQTRLEEAAVNRKISVQIESRLTEFKQFDGQVLLNASCCLRSLIRHSENKNVM